MGFVMRNWAIEKKTELTPAVVAVSQLNSEPFADWTVTIDATDGHVIYRSPRCRPVHDAMATDEFWLPREFGPPAHGLLYIRPPPTPK